jgi:hypothetical protein
MLCTLPKELLHNIFYYLPFNYFFIFRRLSKKYKNIAENYLHDFFHNFNIKVNDEIKNGFYNKLPNYKLDYKFEKYAIDLMNNSNLKLIIEDGKKKNKCKKLIRIGITLVTFGKYNISEPSKFEQIIFYNIVLIKKGLLFEQINKLCDCPDNNKNTIICQECYNYIGICQDCKNINILMSVCGKYINPILLPDDNNTIFRRFICINGCNTACPICNTNTNEIKDDDITLCINGHMVKTRHYDYNYDIDIDGSDSDIEFNDTDHQDHFFYL